MRSKKRRTVITVILTVLFVEIVTISAGILYLWNQNAVPKNLVGFRILELENQKSSFAEVYQEEYQNQVHGTIQKLKQLYRYDIQNPLLIANPYQTVTNGLYVYFKTNKSCQVEYVIAADGYNHFVQRASTDSNDNYTKTHEFLMVGLIMGEKNYITINLLDKSDEIIETVTFEYECPNAVGKYNVNTIEVNKGGSSTPVSEGLYAILGNDVEMDMENVDQKEAYLSMYDNDGILRVEIPLISYRAHRLLFDENGMYFNVSGQRLVRMDKLGYVNRVYQLERLLLHHDYLFGNRGDIVILGTDTAEGTKEDVVFSIGLETKEVSTIIDLKDIFPNYYQMTSKPKSSPYLDWMHINSLSFVDDESLLLSSRETSTIIKLDNIYNKPTIDYMIGSENFWDGTGYEQYLLEQVGDFSLHAGQHTVTYMEVPEGEAGQYYIYLFNNNNTVSYTRPSYKWSEDSSYVNTGRHTTSNGADSSYYKYLVDTKNRTFTLVDLIEVEYSGYVSSTQEYKGNIIIDSGSPKTAWEYDPDGELIQEINVVGNSFVYRVYKYDFDGYWFQNKAD